MSGIVTMLSIRLLLGAAALICTVSGQTSSIPFCDSLTGICYTSYTTPLGISYRIALPSTNGSADVTILQIVAPVTIGWAGFAWGGTMPWNPLGLNLPVGYTGAEYTYLRGTGTNSTHWTVTVLCRGCTTWKDSDGSNAAVLLNGTTKFAYAYALAPPLKPADNSSAFNVHDNIGKWIHDVKGSQSSKFDSWVANNPMPSAPPISQSSSTNTKSSTATSLPPASTTLSTSTVLTSTVAVGSGIPTACPGVSLPKYPSVVANGWRATKVKGDMGAARGVVFDSAGHLLVIESGKGITAHTLDSTGCVQSSKTIVSQRNLNHGICFDANSTTLYASSMTVVFSWTYDAVAIAVVGPAKTIIKGMYNSGHPTRSLLMSPSHPNSLLVSHGASENIDYPSGNIQTGRAMIRVFDLNLVPSGGYNYSTGGYLIGYGLRNAVGLAFDLYNKLWVTENGSDELTRTAINGQAVDIHGDNPAEELNYIGDISPNTNWCFRPAGMVFDPLGRMYITSDASGEGEMWLLGKV
ncbi:hypothetical protein EG329_007418 [Mollisiaceae sp. DMI_Dod_QoI]|nr:hypothetical protein EG329_007418 [Helotiales sp. DMI_Dod_QoI]